jgi:hypothetical protein
MLDIICQLSDVENFFKNTNFNKFEEGKNMKWRTREELLDLNLETWSRLILENS